MTDDEIETAVQARLDAEEAAGIPRTITNPVVLAELARIIEDAEERPNHRGS